MSREKVAIIASIALCLTWSYFLVLTTTSNDWREGWMRQVPTLGTPFRREKSTIKKEERETGRGGDHPTHKKHQKELMESCRGPILSDELKPSQLDRSSKTP